MFFVLSKVLAFLTLPSNILISLVIIGTILLFTRFARAGRRMVLFGVVWIVLVGLSPLGLLLMGVLENRFPAWDASRGAPTGFIVLGGALDPELTQARHSPVMDGAAERITIVAELARRYPDAKFIYSSGSASVFGGLAEADYVLPLFESFGIPRARIVIERRSRNTEENARFSKVLAAPRPGDRWVVITSAIHMPRAIGAFRAAGFPVEAFPVDWHTRPGAGDAFTFFTFFTSGLIATDAAAHEFAGLVMYRLTGRSSGLLPGPRQVPAP
jgi:uncharacterized SAM-binding protein YcdF (DUF218 family)